MKAKIDAVLCTGHGRCYAYADQVYDLDDNGYNAARGQVVEINSGQEAAARLGAENCPERAITFEIEGKGEAINPD
jgi:ferredoxin